jgi:hypothetical protein
VERVLRGRHSGCSLCRVDGEGADLNNKIIAAAAIGLMGLASFAASANVPGNATAAAHAGERTHTTSVGGLTLPQYIGPLEFIGAQGGADPRTSATYSYRAMGLALDIHVSDLGASGIADGTQSAELARRFEATKKILVAATEVHNLKARESTVPFSSGDARAVREAVYHFERRGEGGTTYLWFTAMHGLVIDARFDVALGFEEDGDIGRGEILATIGDAIPASADLVAQARVRATEPPDDSVKVAILWDPETPEGESKIWLAYLFARAAFAANETAGGPAVGERESSFDEEVRGRQIALTTFRALKRDSAQPESAYFNDIDRVDAAGFLREYVWSYLRHPSWSATPANLDVAGFDVWRAEHLKNHRSVTHGRIAFRLAAAQ